MKSLVSPFYSILITFCLIFLSACGGGSGPEAVTPAANCTDSTSSFSNAAMLDLGKDGGSIDSGADISSDGLTLYFHSSRVGGSGALDVYKATRSSLDANWGNVTRLGSNINSTSVDTAPHISPDGLSLLFASDRSGGQGGHDIYISTRNSVSDVWGPATNIGSTINTQDRESGPSLSSNGLKLFFYSDRPSSLGGSDIYVSTRSTVSSPWTIPVNRVSLNSTDFEVSPDISADSLNMYFHSNRNGASIIQIYSASRTIADTPWSTPVELDYPVNTSSSEYAPSISTDECELYFSSTRPGSDNVSIWKTTR